jgi:hypothetical protein
MERSVVATKGSNTLTRDNEKKTITDQEDLQLLSNARIGNNSDTEQTLNFERQFQEEVDQVKAASKRTLASWQSAPFSDNSLTHLPTAPFEITAQVANSPDASLEIRYKPATPITLFGPPSAPASIEALITVDLQKFPVKSIALPASADLEAEAKIAEYTRVVSDYAMRMIKTKGRDKGYLIVNSNFESELVEQLTLKCGAMNFPEHYLEMLEAGKFKNSVKKEVSDTSGIKKHLDSLPVQAQLEKLFPNITYGSQFNSWLSGLNNIDEPGAWLAIAIVILPFASCHAATFASLNTINSNTKANWAKQISHELEQNRDRGIHFKHFEDIITCLYRAAKSDSSDGNTLYRGSVHAIVETTLLSLRKLTPENVPGFIKAISSLKESPAHVIKKAVLKLLE